MKAIRQIVGFVWIGVFLWGIFALVQGKWASLGIAVVVWCVLGAIFSAIHNALERSEAGSVEHLFRFVGFAVQQGDWETALASSETALEIASNGANRDRSLLGGGGNGDNMLPVMGIALLNHGTLLGATGRIHEGREAIDRGVAILSRSGAGDAHAQQYAEVVKELQSPSAGTAQFQQVARVINGPL